MHTGQACSAWTLSAGGRCCCWLVSVCVCMWIIYNCTLCLSKVPTFKLSVILSNLNWFSEILHCWKASESCYKNPTHYPPHLRHVATLPLEIKNSKHVFETRCRSWMVSCRQLEATWTADELLAMSYCWTLGLWVICRCCNGGHLPCK